MKSPPVRVDGWEVVKDNNYYFKNGVSSDILLFLKFRVGFQLTQVNLLLFAYLKNI